MCTAYGVQVGLSTSPRHLAFSLCVSLNSTQYSGSFYRHVYWEFFFLGPLQIGGL